MKETFIITMSLIFTALTLSIFLGLIFNICYTILQKTAKLIYVGLFYIGSIGELLKFNLPTKGSKRLIMDLSANLLLVVISIFIRRIWTLTAYGDKLISSEILPLPVAILGMALLFILYYLSWKSKPNSIEDKDEFFDEVTKLKLPTKFF